VRTRRPPCRRPSWPAGILAAALILGAGCATTLPSATTNAYRRALRSIPEVPCNQLRADRAILAAFFAANNVPLSPAEIAQIIPPANPPGLLDRHALKKIATQKKRVLLVVKADERFLWDELGHNLPLLVLLPDGIKYQPTAPAFIPIAWDQKARVIELLDGNGEIQHIAETSFFTRRDPLRQAALCLTTPGHMSHFQPTREQKLVLADFWYDSGFYRRATATYTAVARAAPTDTTDVAALLGQGNTLVQQHRYDDAIPIFRAALAADPDNPRVLNNLAYCHLQTGTQLMTALRHANKAVQLDPTNPIILETLGSLNLKIGDAATAARHLEHAWAHARKRSPEIQIAIMDQLVRAWLASGRNDLAWQVAEHRHRAFPEYKMPADILSNFPALRQRAVPYPESKPAPTPKPIKATPAPKK